MKKPLTRGCKCGIISLPLREGFFFVPPKVAKEIYRNGALPHRGVSVLSGGRYTDLGFPRENGSNNFYMGGAAKMANDARVKITLVCTECKQRNYDTKKNKKNDPDRLEMKKHCKFCRKHTVHKESK